MNDHDPPEWVLTDAEQRELYTRGRNDGCLIGLLSGVALVLALLFGLAALSNS